uniref:Reverse transcriptase domain-containing protein n=1 Tax=Tanacetum cinerariifolium TaxID=118510 RepID=A0A699GNY7_TANCI|nr:reverse transcriptase domain-containing protein [Tanacetum cinerariifolium]
MSTREYERRHRSRRSRSPRPSVFSRINASGQDYRDKIREKKKEASSKDWETEERVCPYAQTFILAFLLKVHRSTLRKKREIQSSATNDDSGREAKYTKFCEFHGEVGHNTDECMYLKKQIEEMLKAEKLSHLIKELKQNNGKEQPKMAKKGETFGKDKALAILIVQPWERVARQKITQSVSLNPKIFFPPLGEDEGIEGPIIIEAEIRGHCIHRMYVDCGSSSEILYKHCFNRLRPEVKIQLPPPL